MPLNKILQYLKGQCRYCGQNARLLRGQHSLCRDLYATGIQEMTQLPAALDSEYNAVGAAKLRKTIKGSQHGQPGEGITASTMFSPLSPPVWRPAQIGRASRFRPAATVQWNGDKVTLNDSNQAPPLRRSSRATRQRKRESSR